MRIGGNSPVTGPTRLGAKQSSGRRGLQCGGGGSGVTSSRAKAALPRWNAWYSNRYSGRSAMALQRSACAASHIGRPGPTRSWSTSPRLKATLGPLRSMFVVPGVHTDTVHQHFPIFAQGICVKSRFRKTQAPVDHQQPHYQHQNPRGSQQLIHHAARQ